MKNDLHVLTAEPIDEPDQAVITWPKRKWRLPRGRTRCRPTPRYHPGTKQARQILNELGRSLTTCEDCGMEGVACHVHHKNWNPHDNHPSNLLVLCKYCHATRHHIVDAEGVKPWYFGTIMVNEEEFDEG